MYSNSAYYASGYITAPLPYGSAPTPGFGGNPPLYGSTSRYSSSSFTYTPRTSTSSYTYPPSHVWQTSSDHWGPGYRLSGEGRQVQYHQQQPQNQQPGQQNSVQYEYRVHMPQWSNVQSFAQIPRNIGQIFRRPRQEFMASEDPSYGHGSGGDHNGGSGRSGGRSSHRHVPRSAGYAYISTAEKNRRARAYNCYSRGRFMPIWVDSVEGQQKYKSFPDDWHQLIYMPSKYLNNELLIYFSLPLFRKNTNTKNSGECGRLMRILRNWYR